MSNEIIYGRQPVRELLRAGRRTCACLTLSESGKPSPELKEIEDLAIRAGVPVDRALRARLDKITDGGNHQGVVMTAAEYPYVEFGDMIDRMKAGQTPGFVLLLDHIQEPQNL